MDTIKNEDLRNVFHYLSTIENIIEKEIGMVNGNKSHLDKIVPEDIKRVYSLKQARASDFVSNLAEINYESALITLVATFEKIVFAKYRTSYGEIRSVVNTHTPDTMDYYSSRESFVNDGIDKLSGIIHLIESRLSTELVDKLKKIKEHRDYIAHGKRFSLPSSVNFSLEEIVVTLDNIVTEIQK